MLARAQLLLTSINVIFSSFCAKIAFIISETKSESSLSDGNSTKTPNALHAAALTLTSGSEASGYSKVIANL